jgi:hypothetical protein
MDLLARVMIRGAKRFKGNLDGKDIDSGKLFVDVDLKGENSFGCCTQEIRCTDSKLVDSIKHLTFPFAAEVSMVVTTNGTKTENVITAIKPQVQQRAA